MKKITIIILVIICIYFLTGFLVVKYQSDNPPEQSNNLIESTNEIVKEKLPTIKSSELPNGSEDFDVDKYEFLHGGYAGENGKYAEVRVDGDPIETDISISYSNKIRPLDLKSDEEINNMSRNFSDDTSESYKESINNQILKYGKMASQYLPEEGIVNYYESDVDNDGIKEKLVTICGLESNHCSDYAEIIKGNNVIFFTKLGTNSIGIRPDKNGFYISWTDENSFIDENGVEHGYCCEASHNKTLFLFENGKFIPTKQWKVPHILKEVVGD